MRIVISIILLIAWPAYADVLEVKHNANVYKEASRHSPVLKKFTVGGSKVILPLASDTRKNGYYQVTLTGTTQKGWIYKSLVRRFESIPEFVAYKRSLYLHWIDANGDCQNTRAEILIRDNRDRIAHLKFKPRNDHRKCVVVSGAWKDPYTGKIFTRADQVDVDHVVPLKNAHYSGAWAWSREKKEQYANDESPNHLLTVSASENRKKGAKGPDQYLPPNKAYQCQYVRIWVQIKKKWELEMTEPEGEAVERVLARCH